MSVIVDGARVVASLGRAWSAKRRTPRPSPATSLTLGLAVALAVAVLGCGSVPVGKDAGAARDTGAVNVDRPDAAGNADVPAPNPDGDTDGARPKPPDAPIAPADGGPLDVGPSTAIWDLTNTTWDNSVWN